VSGSSSKFDIYFTNLYPEEYGADTTPFETAKIGKGRATAEFVSGKKGDALGFGLFGMAGMGTNGERIGRTVEEKADMWLGK
jgi:hypothetical protein